MKITVSNLKKIIREALEDHIEEEIDELRAEPEFKSIDAFIEYKLDNEEFQYNFIELQALARNLTAKRMGRKDISVAAQPDIQQIKKELGDMGFEFVGRKPVKKVRGVSSPMHGTHPFAGSGAGGSGFGSNFDGPSFTSFGGGPGAIGGGYKWSPDDSRSLGMGANRKKR